MIPRPLLTPTQCAILALTVLSLLLGGATELWAQALLAAGAGCLVLIAPPLWAPGRVPIFLAVALFALALGSFLPADWTSAPPWRQHLGGDLQLPLGPMRTPQPWLTLQWCSLLLVALVWTCYLFSQSWTPQQRGQAICVLVFCVALMGALMTAAYLFGFRVPGWNEERNRGWFPNRNQTADVLAVCGILNYALVFNRLRKGHASGYFWIAPLACICTALVIGYSRAGIIMFFAGICFWHMGTSGRRKSVKRTSLSLTFVFLLLTLFLLFGGATVERFMSESPGNMPLQMEYRVAIQKDAFLFSLQEPGLGIGLGNFESLFASARQASIGDYRAIHPESDWLWAACELGWIAPVLFLAAIVWWLRRCLPLQPRKGESLRRAVIIAVLMFIAHGFVDVSGHRIGSAWLGLLLAGIAMMPEPRPNPARIGLPVFRGCGGVLLFIAAWWFASIADAPVPPTTATLDRLQEQLDSAKKLGNGDEQITLANAALKIAPLNWTFYFARAGAEALQPDQTPQAAADFEIARAIEPHWMNVTYEEGLVWLNANQPDLCVDAWKETLDRLTISRPEMFAHMLDQATSDQIVHEGLGAWAANKMDYLLIFLNYASPAEMKQDAARILATDPNLQRLTDDQRGKFFQAWWNRGDQTDLITHLLAHEDWIPAGWSCLARYHAQQKDFTRAWELVSHFGPVPAIPDVHTDQPLPELEHEFSSRHDDLAVGIMLCLSQIKQGEKDRALATLRTIDQIKDHPKYLDYLEARLWADQQQFEQAWNAWLNYATP